MEVRYAAGVGSAEHTKPRGDQTPQLLTSRKMLLRDQRDAGRDISSSYFVGGVISDTSFCVDFASSLGISSSALTSSHTPKSCKVNSKSSCTCPKTTTLCCRALTGFSPLLPSTMDNRWMDFVDLVPVHTLSLRPKQAQMHHLIHTAVVSWLQLIAFLLCI